MSNFIISYDLHNQRTYEPVWRLLQSWGAVRLLESLWLLEANSNTGTIRDALQSVIDNDDSVVVIELKAGSNWSAIRAQFAGTQWLTSHIRRYPVAA